MANNATNQTQTNSSGFQLWLLSSLIFGFVWSGMFTVLTRTYVLEVTGFMADARGTIQAIGTFR